MFAEWRKEWAISQLLQALPSPFLCPHQINLPRTWLCACHFLSSQSKVMADKRQENPMFQVFFLNVVMCHNDIDDVACNLSYYIMSFQKKRNAKWRDDFWPLRNRNGFDNVFRRWELYQRESACSSHPNVISFESSMCQAWGSSFSPERLRILIYPLRHQFPPELTFNSEFYIFHSCPLLRGDIRPAHAHPKGVPFPS